MTERVGVFGFQTDANHTAIRLTQQSLETLVHEVPAHLNDQIGNQFLLVSSQTVKDIHSETRASPGENFGKDEQAVLALQHVHLSRQIPLLILPHAQCGKPCLTNGVQQFVGKRNGRIGSQTTERSFSWQFVHGELKKRLVNGHVEVSRTSPVLAQLTERLVDGAVVLKARLFIVGRSGGQTQQLLRRTVGVERSVLHQRLPVGLSDLPHRAVCRNDQQRNVAEISLRHSRQTSQHGRARGDANRSEGCVAIGKCQSQRHESRAALIGHGVESHTLWMVLRQKVEVVNNDAVARAGANDHVA